MQHDENLPENLTIVDVIRETFVNYLNFAGLHLRNLRPPAQYLVIWFLGMDAVAGGLELERVYYGEYMVDNWFYAWVRIMFAGFAMGVVRYWFVGTLFHGVVRFAGGKREPARTSRYIFLYAALPVAIIDLMVKVAQMLIYQNDYFALQTVPVVDSIFAFLMVGGFVLSLRWGYLGMRHILGTDRVRSLLIVGALLLFATIAMLGTGGGQ